MSKNTSGEIFRAVIFAVICGVGYWLFPSGENWFPLKIDSNTATYYDRNSLSWKGNVVLLSVKLINKDGTPIQDSGYQIENKYPQGEKAELSLDCQQHISRILNISIFLREGQYSTIPIKDISPDVLDDSSKLLSLCESERPGWNPFRYKLIRDYFFH